ncbi:NAD-dependent epimerase/dehydratase family protein, partial [Microbulbifer hainanensis]|uniref:NAD-dependent epimerase/dehydratase family protein n=1 Tax=Microbulbifer hainanensis TaxID=2735675 RepID=UPI0018661EB2
MTTVLVTGGSGFIASHCIVELLKKNYNVRVTLRNKSRIEYVRGMIKAGGVTDLSKLSFHIADLNSDDGWKEALDSVSYVMHIASPFPSGQVRDKEKVITTASQGTLRVLKFSESARVKRVILTSSFGAIGYGHPRSKLSYSENDWSDTKNTALSPYIKSKTMAEKLAWEYIRTSESALELSVINPVGVFGPTLGSRLSSSLTLIQMMLEG